MDPSALSSSSTRPDTSSGAAQSISSATISSSTVTSAAITCSLVSSSAPPTSSLTSSRPPSATAVPTTVITSVRSAILPFPYCNSNSEQHSKENPNLVSLLSGNSDSMSGDSPPPPPTSKPMSSGVAQNTTLQSILLAKDPEFIPSPPNASPRASSLDNGNNGHRVPLPPQSHPQQHHFPLSEKCQSFLISAGFQTSTFMPACPQQQQQQQQPVAKSSNHGNCMIYKGYKKLCNAQSLFKCNKSSTANCPPPRPPVESHPQFQPNHPYGPTPAALMEHQAHRQSPMSISNPTSPSASGTCILGDLLRRGNKSRNKNYTSSDTSSLMDTAASDSNDRLSLASQNGASITAGVLAASMADDIMEQPVPPGSAANNNNNFSVSYYSQLLKRRIRKLYHDSDAIAGTDSQVYLQQQHQQQQQQQQQQILNESSYLPRARSASDATKYQGMVPSNFNRKSVISKLDAIPPNHFQQARAMFCNQMAELAGYKLPFCQPSSSNSVPVGPVGPAGPSTSSSHQSVNSYLDTLIRSNVSRDQSVLTGQTAAQSSTSSLPTSSGSVVSNSVITTVADINPNKPQHFVNLIDKIISNVFIGTTTTAAVVTGANSGASTSTTSCFMSPTSSLSSPPAPQSCSSLMSVLSSPEQLDAPSPSPSQMSTHDPGPSSVAPLGPPPTPPSRPPSRPPSTVSAITQLLNSDGSPPASPPSQPASPCQSHSDYSSTRPSPRPSPHPSPKPPSSNPMECINDISDKVYQQLIEFEFNHESILKKFQTIPGTDSHIIQSSRPGLNPNEKARIEELEKVLYPLQFCLSSMCEQREALKRNLQKSFFQKNSGVSVDFQRQTLLATTEQAINLLIELTKQLDSFSELSSADQMNLLRTSVMEIMLMRSILILPQRFKEKMNNSLKRCFDENGTGPSAHNHDNCCSGKLLSAIYEGKSKEDASSSTSENGGGEEEQVPTKDDLEPCTSHPHDRPFVDLASLDHRRLEDLMNSDEIGSESSRDSFADDSSAFSGSGDIQAADYAKQFRAHYIKLARSIDKDWYEDKTIFYLLFAILLFRPTKSNIADVEKVREEHLTYVYLLKRYLENKFKSYCTARSHFIRIFDRLEELQKMNDQVIQKLLDFDLVCAQNLLEKLCIC